MKQNIIPNEGDMVIVLHMEGLGNHPVWKETFVTRKKNKEFQLSDVIVDIMGDKANTMSIEDYQRGWFLPTDKLPVIEKHLNAI